MLGLNVLVMFEWMLLGLASKRKDAGLLGPATSLRRVQLVTLPSIVVGAKEIRWHGYQGG